MKKAAVIFASLMFLWLGFNGCDKKGTDNDPPENPGYYFPINFYYKWTYVLVNYQCEVSDDSFAVSAASKNTRFLQEIGWESGWDIVASGGGTTFVYHKSDTIFTLDIGSTQLPTKVLVGPIRQGTFWRDSRGYEYVVGGVEDIYSDAAGGVYKGCARVRRTISGDSKKTDVWWAPQVGKVKRVEITQGGQCVSGEELRRLDKHPDFP